MNILHQIPINPLQSYALGALTENKENVLLHEAHYLTEKPMCSSVIECWLDVPTVYLKWMDETIPT